MISLSFGEFPPDVCEAAYGSYRKFGVALDKGAVGAQAVALEMTFKGRLAVFADEDALEAGVGAAFMPIKKNAVVGVVVSPEVSLDGLPGSGFEAADRGFVDLDVIAAADAGAEKLIEWDEPLGK